ncbi:hypothetical protein [Azotobacter beijerinckii]|nr:hypothetical protein [Azotobacter beijerinckii]
MRHHLEVLSRAWATFSGSAERPCSMSALMLAQPDLESSASEAT